MFQEHRTSQLRLDLDTGEDDSASLKSYTDMKSKHYFEEWWTSYEVISVYGEGVFRTSMMCVGRLCAWRDMSCQYP